jgi:seryl-tRNA synthetase
LSGDYPKEKFGVPFNYLNENIVDKKEKENKEGEEEKENKEGEKEKENKEEEKERENKEGKELLCSMPFTFQLIPTNFNDVINYLVRYLGVESCDKKVFSFFLNSLFFSFTIKIIISQTSH